MRLQRRSSGLLWNRRHRWRRNVVRHASKTVHTGGLRLQASGLGLHCRREHRVDTSRLRLEAPEARWLRCHTLEPELAWLLGLQLLLLLDSKLRLRLEPCGLRLQSCRLWLESCRLWLEACRLWLETLLVQLGQTLSRRSKLRPGLRESGQLWLQRSRAKSSRLLREVLRRRQRSGWRGRKKRTLAQVLRRLRALTRRLLKASGLLGQLSKEVWTGTGLLWLLR